MPSKPTVPRGREEDGPAARSGAPTLDHGSQQTSGPRGGSLTCQLRCAIREGNAELAGQLLVAHLVQLAPCLARWARLAGLDRDELLSEIYLRSWPHLNRITVDEYRVLDAYLQGVARNVALQERRRRLRDQPSVDLKDLEPDLAAFDASLESLEGDESHDALEQALASVLPARYLAALKLHADGCRPAAIAAKLDKSFGATEDLLRHARKAARVAVGRDAKLEA